MAQFSAIGLDANVFLRRLDDYWKNPDLIEQLPEGNGAFLAGLYSPNRKTRSEYFAGCYAISLLPAFNKAQAQLERIKQYFHAGNSEISYNKETDSL